jgi:hypothetical protein
MRRQTKHTRTQARTHRRARLTGQIDTQSQSVVFVIIILFEILIHEWLANLKAKVIRIVANEAQNLKNIHCKFNSIIWPSSPA